MIIGEIDANTPWARPVTGAVAFRDDHEGFSAQFGCHGLKIAGKPDIGGAVGLGGEAIGFIGPVERTDHRNLAARKIAAILTLLPDVAKVNQDSAASISGEGRNHPEAWAEGSDRGQYMQRRHARPPSHLNAKIGVSLGIGRCRQHDRVFRQPLLEPRDQTFLPGEPLDLPNAEPHQDHDTPDPENDSGGGAEAHFMPSKANRRPGRRRPILLPG